MQTTVNNRISKHLQAVKQKKTRAEVQALLREIAFVLKVTRQVKEEIVGK